MPQENMYEVQNADNATYLDEKMHKKFFLFKNDNVDTGQ